MNSFIMVNITPYAIDSLEDKSMLVHFKKAFPLTPLGHSFERRAYYLLLCFESYQGIPYSHTGRVDTSLMININPICNLFYLCQEKPETWLVSQASR